jgi:DNA polymerase III alpha subunit
MICTQEAGVEILLRDRTLHGIVFEPAVANQYNAVAEELGLEPLCAEPNWSTEFDIPTKYTELDVEQYLYNLCQEDHERERVDQELALYKARNLIPVLQLMIYIVDTMRSHDIVWGVGRGSSVASYCLYLIGIHRIDSIKYDLDIHEFLK